jgi:hypothetical protein
MINTFSRVGDNYSAKVEQRAKELLREVPLGDLRKMASRYDFRKGNIKRAVSYILFGDYSTVLETRAAKKALSIRESEEI